jgi:hypothetical protein
LQTFSDYGKGRKLDTHSGGVRVAFMEVIMMISLLDMEENEFLEEVNRRKVTEWYSDSGILRSLVQTTVPYMGAIVDAVLALPGTKSKEQRVNAFLIAFYHCVKAIDQRLSAVETIESEEFQDCLIIAIESSMQTRSREKIIMNAMIMANLINANNTENYRPEEYLRAIADLSPAEVSTLRILYDFEKLPPKGDQTLMQSQGELNTIVHEKTGIEMDDMKFLWKRLERTGFVSEMTGAMLGYIGGRFIASPSLNRFMDYLNLHPFARWSGFTRL